MMQRILTLIIAVFLAVTSAACHSGTRREKASAGTASLAESPESAAPNGVVTGAEQPGVFLPLLEGKSVALVVNHTAMSGGEHLVDFLVRNNIRVARIFAPEHGFRGEASAGEKVADGRDEKSGVEIVSLYGDNRKPSPAHLKGIDVVVFDIQDVGCRFYTYLSTLHLVIEACAENGIPLVVLDRPNPNGDYVAGPLLQPGFSSFVGMVPVPVVHGCTMGEMALMINGEKWHKAPDSCAITVVKADNYTHLTRYEPPVAPSPNLPNIQSIRLYPSLCCFEATAVSIGRGTPYPFQVIGGTRPELGSFTFVPADIPGFVNNPINEGKTCYGTDLRTLDPVPPFTLEWFIEFYRKYPVEKEFLTSERWFNLLTGNDQVIKAIRAGKSAGEIALSWQEEVEKYKTIRKKYLLYPDFE